jgi:hypothetical protein
MARALHRRSHGLCSALFAAVTGFGLALPGLWTGPAYSQQTPSFGQETLDQFNAANAENRRYSEVQNQLRNQALRLQQERDNAVVGCQGIGSAGGQSACRNNVQIQIQQRNLMLDNRALQQRNTHQTILNGIGVNPQQ